MENYRVFISYSHEDGALVENIVAALKRNGLRPMWDRNFMVGRGFHEEIKNYIEHAHVFMPFITESSTRRGWVHQEIGYAKALNIPVLPITKDRVPGELLQDLLAVKFSHHESKLARKLTPDVFDKVVVEAQRTAKPLFYLAEHPENRTMMMVEYARRVLDLGDRGHVRQKGGLSSFSIPDEIGTDQVWKDRYGDHHSAFRCEHQRRERQVLEKHVRERGCSLIIDSRDYFRARFGPQSMRTRLRTLVSFLKSFEGGDVRVAIAEPEHGEHHLTIVGDWFVAEAVSASRGTGIRHTIFTRHGPTVLTRIVSFDQELEGYLRAQGISAAGSRIAAISRLEQMLGAFG